MGDDEGQRWTPVDDPESQADKDYGRNEYDNRPKQSYVYFFCLHIRLFV